jgi:hypothetical protein
MSTATRIAWATALATLAAPHLASAAPPSETDYLKRFEGSFSGAGKVRTAANGSPYNVKCNVSGNATESRITLDGTCRAMAVVSRKIGANLTVSPDGTYSGVYTGSKIGPARIRGRRHGDNVILTVTWPKPVNGDQKATMTISNSGNGFSFAVDDEATPGGQVVRMTDINLTP